MTRHGDLDLFYGSMDEFLLLEGALCSCEAGCVCGFDGEEEGDG